MPPANPTAASAGLPPKLKAIGLRMKNSAAGNSSSIAPTLSLKLCGSARATNSAPIGMPASPPITNGRASLKSITRHIEGRVEICELTEQISTSGTASEGGST
jgi:hypothetical protein